MFELIVALAVVIWLPGAIVVAVVMETKRYKYRIEDDMKFTYFFGSWLGLWLIKHSYTEEDTSITQ